MFRYNHFLLSPKSPSYTLLYIIGLIIKPVAIKFSLLPYKTLEHKKSKFSPDPTFQIGFWQYLVQNPKLVRTLSEIILTFA